MPWEWLKRQTPAAHGRRELTLHGDGRVHRQPPHERRVDAQHVDDEPRGDLAAVDEARIPVLRDALVVVCADRPLTCIR